MKPQSTGANFIQATAFQFRGIGRRAGILEDYFNSGGANVVLSAVQMAASYFDGLAGFALVGVANDIGEGFIHRTNDGARLISGKMKKLGRAFDGGTHQREGFWVAFQLQLE